MPKIKKYPCHLSKMSRICHPQYPPPPPPHPSLRSWGVAGPLLRSAGCWSRCRRWRKTSPASAPGSPELLQSCNTKARARESVHSKCRNPCLLRASKSAWQHELLENSAFIQYAVWSKLKNILPYVQNNSKQTKNKLARKTGHNYYEKCVFSKQFTKVTKTVKKYLSATFQLRYKRIFTKGIFQKTDVVIIRTKSTVPASVLTYGVKKQKSSLLLIVEGYCQVRLYHTVHVTLCDPRQKRNMHF